MALGLLVAAAVLVVHQIHQLPQMPLLILMPILKYTADHMCHIKFRFCAASKKSAKQSFEHSFDCQTSASAVKPATFSNLQHHCQTHRLTPMAFSWELIGICKGHINTIPVRLLRVSRQLNPAP